MIASRSGVAQYALPWQHRGVRDRPRYRRARRWSNSTEAVKASTKASVGAEKRLAQSFFVGHGLGTGFRKGVIIFALRQTYQAGVTAGLTIPYTGRYDTDRA